MRMKLLFDFIPLILFFVTFRWATSHADASALWATEHMGWAVSGGVVAPSVAPMLLATLVVIASTLAQVVYLMARRQKVSPALWMSLLIITVMGGLTVWLQSDVFIKWKPTLLYGAFALVLSLGHWVAGKNLLRSMLGKELRLPDMVWHRLLVAWVAFFVVAALLNLWVAYSFDTSTWVNFKVFGLIALTLIFTLAQGLYMARFLQEDAADKAASQASPSKPT
jgi:intracellular septation protein